MTATGAISFAEFLESKVFPADIRSHINFVAGVMEKSGRTSSWDDVSWRNRITEPTYKMLEKAFPAGPHEMLDLMTDGRSAGDDFEIFVQSDEITVVGDGGGIKEMKRIFNMSSGNLLLNFLKIDKEARNDGKGTRILLGTYEVAKRLGMQRMKLYAENMGSYVWARAGFLPYSHAWDAVRRAASVRLAMRDELGDLKAPIRAKAQTIIDNPAPQAIWALADLEHEIAGDKLGKHLLVGNRWEGEFAVGDPEQEARLKAYAKARS